MPAVSVTPGREHKNGSVRRAPFGVFRDSNLIWRVPLFSLRWDL